MAIDRFTRQRFENALPAGWEGLGLQHGQFVYKLPAGPVASVIVYSSIGSDELARETDEDSIKILVGVPGVNGKMNYRKVLDQDYVTRVAGWEARLKEKCAQAATVAARVKQAPGNCPVCGEPRLVWFAQKNGHKGRPFAKCPAHENSFLWLDMEEKAESKGMAPAVAAVQASSLWDDNDNELARAEAVTEKKPVVFSEWQQAVVHSDWRIPKRVIATAGSGKTTTIAEMYRYLVEEEGLDPARILVVTFGSQAATSMREKFADRCPRIKTNKAALDSICTIHAACRRLLDSVGRANRELAKSYKLEDEVRNITKRYWGTEGGTLSIDDETSGGLTLVPKWHEVLAAINYLYGKGLGRNEQLEECVRVWGPFHGPLVAKARVDLDTWFGTSTWTFAHMPYEVHWILRQLDKPDRPRDDVTRTAQDWLARYDHVIVDEAQDTNSQAMDILCRLAGEHITVVGDPDQTMYRFTGGVPEANLYDGFSQRYPTGKTYLLPINYRSTKNIVAAQSKLALYNYQQYGGVWSDEFIKSMQAREDAPEGSPVEFFMWDDPDQQAEMTVGTIEMFLEKGYKPGDFFILCRTRNMTVDFEAMLLRAGVPFINTASGSFWLQPHVAKLVAYVRLSYHLLVGEDDGESFRRVYNVATRHFQARGAYSSTRMLGEKFLLACNSSYLGAERAAASSRFWYYGVEDLTRFVAQIQTTLTDTSVGNALQLVYDECLEAYTRDQAGEADDSAIRGTLDDLETVIEIGRRFGTDTQAFLDHVQASEAAAEAAKNKDWDEYVVLGTCHKVKGLERPIVFVPGLCEGEDESGPYGLLPHTYALRESGGDEGVLASPFCNTLTDERCIAFVALSRAQEHLILSGVNTWRNKLMAPSRFIYEAGIAGNKEEKAGLA